MPWREVFPSPYLSLHPSPFFLAWQRYQTYSLNNSPSLLGEWLPVKVSSTHVIGFPNGGVLWEIIANNKVGVTTSAMKQEPRLLGIPGPRRLLQTLGLFDEISVCPVVVRYRSQNLETSLAGQDSVGVCKEKM